MVKLTGPGLAGAASGTLGDELIFSNWKGKAYLKKHAKPKQPRTANQVAMRAIMSFLSNQWSQITPAHKATWDDLAAASRISPFNAYQRANLTRWRNFQRPSTRYPPGPIIQLGATTGYGVIGQRLKMLCTFNILTLQEVWGMNIHHVSGDTVPIQWNDLVHIEPLPNTGWYTFTIGPFEPGLVWLCFNRFNEDGLPSTYHYWLSDTVTA